MWLAALVASGRLFLDFRDKTVAAGSYELWVETSSKQRGKLARELREKDELLEQKDKLIARLQQENGEKPGTRGIRFTIHAAV